MPEKIRLGTKDIKQFMDRCAQGKETYALRRELFVRQRAAVEAEIVRLNRVADMLKYKCWYYQRAMEDQSEEKLKNIKPEDMPEDIRKIFEKIKN